MIKGEIFYSGRWRNKSKRLGGRRMWVLFVLITGTIILGITDIAYSQIREEVKKELEKTDRVIERAKEAVRESGNPKAQSLLEIAINLQTRAKEAFDQERIKLAGKLTLQAREKAFEAIGLTKRNEENENLVLKAIERTDEIIAKAKEDALLSDSPRASSLLEVAIRNQERAKEFYHERKLKMALKLTLEARELAQKSMELTDRKDKLERIAKNQLERTDRLIDKAGPIIKESGSLRAQELFDEGVNLQEKAWDLFRQNRFGLAIKGTQRARSFVLRALGIVEENVTPQMVKKAIQQNDELIEKVGPQIKVSGNQQAINLFEEGLSHQEKAKRYLDDGKLKAALAQAKVADRLITKAFDMIGKEGL